MGFVIIHIGPPPCYAKAYKGERPSMDVTFQRSEAQRFESELDAEMEIVRLGLNRQWFVTRL